MAENRDRRVIDIYYNVNTRQLQDVDGVVLRRGMYPFVYFKEHSLINLRLVTDSDGTGFDWYEADALSFSVSIDTDYNSATDPMARTEDADINRGGDWSPSGSDDSSSYDSASAGETADPTTGEFSIRINTYTAEYESKIAAKDVLRNGILEIVAYSSDESGEAIARYQIPIWCYNAIDPTGASVPEITDGISYRGTEQITNGASTVTVADLSVSFTPVYVLVSVRKPDSSGLVIFASVRADSITTAGFIADLSGQVDSGNYYLDYIMLSA